LGLKIILFWATEIIQADLSIPQNDFYKKDFFSNFVQFLAQNLVMLVPTTYPKFSSRSVVDFTESQI
jgi:hypothetical protein